MNGPMVSLSFELLAAGSAAYDVCECDREDGLTVDRRSDCAGKLWTRVSTHS